MIRKRDGCDTRYNMYNHGPDYTVIRIYCRDDSGACLFTVYGNRKCIGRCDRSYRRIGTGPLKYRTGYLGSDLCADRKLLPDLHMVIFCGKIYGTYGCHYIYRTLCTLRNTASNIDLCGYGGRAHLLGCNQTCIINTCYRIIFADPEYLTLIRIRCCK